jgi:hypothetical protein
LAVPIRINELPHWTVLHEAFHYDPATGIFTWKRHRNLTGRPAGSKLPGGHVLLRLNGRQMLAHRAAWVYMYGEIAVDQVIDHRNKNASDNRLINLRLVTHQMSCQNRAVDGGITRSGRRWRVHGMFDGKAIVVGSYTSEKAAAEASDHWRRINYPGYIGGKPKLRPESKD